MSSHLFNQQLSHYDSIANFLKSFEDTTLSSDDYSTTVRDTMWNVDQIIGECNE